jgi:hypothetical protein
MRELAKAGKLSSDVTPDTTNETTNDTNEKIAAEPSAKAATVNAEPTANK